MRFLTLLLLLSPLLAQQSDSREKERALGQGMAAEIRRSAPPLADPAVQAYVNRVAAELTRELPEARFVPTFEIVLHPELKEPAPLPGGIVLVPAASLIAARDEDEFAGMLAHAIAHTILEEPAQVSPGSVWLWFPLHSDAQTRSVSLPVRWLEQRRSREMEADRLGMQIASRARFDPSSYRRYIDREQRDSNSKFVGLPARATRLAEIDKTLAAIPAVDRQVLVDEFGEAREAVRRALAEQRRPPTLHRSRNH